MTTEHTLFKSPEIELVLDDKMLMEVETCPGQMEGGFYALTDSATGALNIATRIIYAVWTVNPELADMMVRHLSKDIPAAFNLLERHK